MGKKKKVLSSKTIKDITNTVPMMLGLGATATFNSWAEIENFAKHHGVYTAPELRKLITEHSPLAKIGDTNLEIARIKKETSLDRLREQLKRGDISYYPSRKNDNWKLFREGKINSWKGHFNDNQFKDIEKIEGGFFSVFSRLIYYVAFTLRRLIFRIE